MANILFVDDDRDIEETFGEVLRSRSHDVRTASGGEQGLELLKAAPLPDVVILDVDMPGMTGPAMAHQMLLHDAVFEMVDRAIRERTGPSSA